MELVVKEKTKKRLVFEFKGATHTLCNAIKEELWQDKAITAAAYNVEHPLIGIPKMIIETDGSKTPDKALNDCLARLEKKNKSFSTAFAKL